MVLFVTFDPNDDGRIIGRFSVSEGQETHYPNRVLITQEIYHSQPEMTMKVDLATRTLVPIN